MELFHTKHNGLAITAYTCLTIFLLFIYGCSKEDDINLDLPPKLSETGIFTSNMSDLIPTTEYVYYELSSSLFSDYAEKQRLIKLPPGEQLTKIEDGLPSFPDGTTIVKTFYYWLDERTPSKGKIILETRILHLESNDWKVTVYKWNKEQTEAYYLTSGNDEPVNWIDKNGEGRVTTYHIPSTKECITCHQSDDQFQPIGLKMYNLNTQVETDFGTMNQLEHFQQIGLINTFDISSVGSLPNYNDNGFSEMERARAYMEINCAHCHSPGNFGFVPFFDMPFFITGTG